MYLQLKFNEIIRTIKQFSRSKQLSLDVFKINQLNEEYYCKFTKAN